MERLIVNLINVDDGIGDNTIVIEIIDSDETKKTRALKALRNAIRQTDFINKEIYASECYTVMSGYARTYGINKDLADAIINNLKKKFELKIKEI